MKYLFVFIMMRLFMFLFKQKEIGITENSVLIIAHPDDESMFYTPFLNDNKPLIICLSGINTDRHLELESLCNEKGLKYKIMDFKDGDDWDVNKITLKILKTIKYSINRTKLSLITFDSRGVSGHKNHISCHKAVKKIQKTFSPDIKCFYLKTVGIFEKYFLYLTLPTHSNINIFNGFANMKHHKTQMVWFRYLWILFSNYMVYNTFSPQ